MAKKKEQEFADLGLGTKAQDKNARFINRDGSFNITREGLGFWESLSIYHTLITMRWSKFIMYVLLFYVVANIIFALLYMGVDMEGLAGHKGESFTEHFWEAFFFSAQTITTVGYGYIHPSGIAANTIAAIESMTGLLGFALATGLLYGKFSRPKASLVYSKNLLIAPYRDINGLMFRMANARKSQLIEVEVQVVLSWINDHEKKTRDFKALKLEREKINFFPTSWTIVHPIDEDSPMHGITQAEFDARDAEILIILKAFDDSFSQTVFARSSYKHHEAVWGAKFVPLVKDGVSKSGEIVMEMHRLSEYNTVGLN
ncbi:MAG: ion channel [Bacteroidetes bacterium]|nr:ion channel [Bacteroidota bacterium]